MQISKRAQAIQPSLTLQITARAKQLRKEGRNIIGFGAGEPDFDTPEEIKQKAIGAINAGFTKYTPTSGTPELKEAIAKKFREENNIPYSTEQIIVSCGAKHSLYNVILATINKNDEVLIPVPFWVSYPEMVTLAEGKARFVKTDPLNSFKLTADDLKKAVNKRTRMLILNSPSNPCGTVYSKEELSEICGFCSKNGLLIISDEIYEHIMFDNLKHYSPASFSDELFKRVVTVNGVSKSFSMTGWRIGYLGAPVEICKAVSKIQDHSTSNPSSISQSAAIAALLMNKTIINERCREFMKRRDYIMQRLDGIKALKYVVPRGAFYIFINISRTKLASLKFSSRLLEEAAVAVIPGVAFGCDKFIRVSFATGMENIKEGLDRIEAWLTKL